MEAINENESNTTALVTLIEQGIPEDNPRVSTQMRVRDVIVSTVAGFIASLNQRAINAKQIHDNTLAAVTAAKLADPKTGLIQIKTQEEAEIAGKLVASLAMSENDIEGLWKKETEFFYNFHRALTAKRALYKQPLFIMGNKLRAAAGLYMANKKREAELAAQKANVQLEKKSPGMGFAIIPDKPVVAGFTPKTTYRAEVVDMMALLKAIVEKEAPIDSVIVNQSQLNKDATPIKYSMAKEVMKGLYKGRRFMYPGVYIIKDEGVTKSR